MLLLSGIGLMRFLGDESELKVSRACNLIEGDLTFGVSEILHSSHNLDRIILVAPLEAECTIYFPFLFHKII